MLVVIDDDWFTVLPVPNDRIAIFLESFSLPSIKLHFKRLISLLQDKFDQIFIGRGGGAV